MAITLPTTSGSVLPEYAATNTTYNRSVQSKDGVVVAVFTCSVAYSRTDYLLDSEGKKVGTVQTELGAPQDPTKYGNLFLGVDETEALFNTQTKGGSIGEETAFLIDELIKADLVKRGILESK